MTFADQVLTSMHGRRDLTSSGLAAIMGIASGTQAYHSLRRTMSDLYFQERLTRRQGPHGYLYTKSSRAIVATDKQGHRTHYKSATEAALALGIFADCIRQAASGSMKSYRGLKWEYVRSASTTPGPRAGVSLSAETKAKMSQAKSHKRRAVRQVAADGRIVHVWESIASATRGTGYSVSGIVGSAGGRFTNHKGFRWSYVD